ncbi:uncharacterized protein DS421_4g122000 [Arachis hypogaea]|nr:uncharacterized protein DS421_4g122000 [Arachis hypogaea]
MCLHRVSNVGLHLWHIALPSTRAGQHFCGARPAHRIGTHQGTLGQQQHARAAESGAPRKLCPALHKGREASCSTTHPKRTQQGPHAPFPALPSTRAGQPPGSQFFMG